VLAQLPVHARGENALHDAAAHPYARDQDQYYGVIHKVDNWWSELLLTPLPHEEQVKMGWIDEAGAQNSRFKSTEQGAATSIWAAVAPELEGMGGRYLEDCTIAKPWSDDTTMSGVKPYALDPDNAERLWSISEELIAAQNE
jgi:hypothetical protein